MKDTEKTQYKYIGKSNYNKCSKIKKNKLQRTFIEKILITEVISQMSVKYITINIGQPGKKMENSPFFDTYYIQTFHPLY